MAGTDDRPDPEALLALARQEAGRARLKVFFGGSAGVGKTYAMLEDARRLAADGVDVVAGIVETHGRPETAALLGGLEVLPRKKITYRNVELEELDLDAAIARRPSVILVDELAHTNAPGSRHPKRWQDVMELLEAGIDVNTTLNVQHLESMVDAVAQITGVVVRETVPDAMLERADEIELVDLTPDELLERLAEGKVYVPAQAQRAAENFFQRGNLLALRELALRRTAEHVDEDVLEYRSQQRIARTWPTRERVLVCVGPSPGSEKLVRATRRLADTLDAPWSVVHVEVTGAPPLSTTDRDRIEATLALAETLGGNVARVSGASVPSAVLAYARKHNITQIVAGKPSRSRLRDRFRRSLLDALIRGSDDIAIHVIAPRDEATLAPRMHVRCAGTAYVRAALAVAGATAIGVAAGNGLDRPDEAMLYLFAIVIASLRGRGPGIFAAALSVAAYDFFFIPPRYTFVASDLRHLITFTVMFVVGSAMGTLFARVRHARAVGLQRERRTVALLAFTSEIAAATDVEDVAAAVGKHVEDALGAPAAVLVPNGDGTLSAAAGLQPLAEQEMAVARWAFEHRQPAGRGTDTLPSARLLAVPLWVAGESVGVVVVEIERARRRIDVEARLLLESIARQAAIAITRLRLVASAHVLPVERLRAVEARG